MTAPVLQFTPRPIVLATPTGAKAKDAEWMAADIDYSTENSWPSDRRGKIKLSLAVSAGVVLEITRDSGTNWTQLNRGSPLLAEKDYSFPIQIAKTDKINIRTPTVGGCTIRYCYLDLVFDEDAGDLPQGPGQQGGEITLLASAARTATTNTADQSSGGARGVHVIIDVTAIDALASMTAKVQGKDRVSGKYYDLLTSASISSVSTTILKVYPGIAESANLKASDVIPSTWRVSFEHTTGDSITYSVGANLVP